MCHSVPIWLGPRRLRFVSLSILPQSLILSISISTPVMQNDQALSYRIGKTRQRGFKKSAEELRMGIPALRQYIDARMPLAPLGKAQQYCSVFNFQLVFRRLFLQFAAHCLRTRTDSLRQQAVRIMKEEKKHRSYCSVVPIRQDNA